MNYQGSDFAAYALDLSTTVSGSSGTVTGYGLMRGNGADVYLSVTGTTQPTSVSLTLTDLANSSLLFTGNVEGKVIRGTWSYPSRSMSGSFRMSYEDNIHLLESMSVQGVRGSLMDLFGW